MIGRVSIIAAALTMGAMFASSTSAQSHVPADSGVVQAAPDTSERRTPHQLAPMVISAERDRDVGVLAGIMARSDIWALEREKRALQRTVEQQGREIDRLEGKLAGLQLEESRMVAQIAGLESATAETRAARQRLEARLRLIREQGSVARSGSGEQ